MKADTIRKRVLDYLKHHDCYSMSHECDLCQLIAGTQHLEDILEECKDYDFYDDIENEVEQEFEEADTKHKKFFLTHIRKVEIQIGDTKKYLKFKERELKVLKNSLKDGE